MQRRAQLQPCAGEDGGEGSVSSVCAWGYAKMQAEPHTHTQSPKSSPACLPLRVRKKKSTDYGDCPYRCDPGGDWYAFPSAYLVQVPVGNGVVTEIDLQCQTVEVYDDAQGRAILSEKHAAYGLGQDAIPVGNACTNPNGQTGNTADTCAGYTCGCDSKWQLVGTEAGGPMESAYRMRYRQFFSGGDGGGCFSVIGGWVNSGFRDPNQAAVPVSDLAFERIKAGQGGDSWLANNCGNANWWDGDVDHTSIYVHEQGRIRPDERFELYTHGGTCQWDAAWRYEGLEVYVLPYARTANINCHDDSPTGVSNVHCPSDLPRRESGNYPCEVAGVDACGRICAAMGTDQCNAMSMDSTLKAGYYLCFLLLVESGADLTTPNCLDGGGTWDLHVYTGAPPPPPTGRRLEEQVASASTAEAVAADEGHRRLQTPAPSPPLPPGQTPPACDVQCDTCGNNYAACYQTYSGPQNPASHPCFSFCSSCYGQVPLCDPQPDPYINPGG